MIDYFLSSGAPNVERIVENGGAAISASAAPSRFMSPISFALTGRSIPRSAIGRPPFHKIAST